MEPALANWKIQVKKEQEGPSGLPSASPVEMLEAIPIETDPWATKLPSRLPGESLLSALQVVLSPLRWEERALSTNQQLVVPFFLGAGNEIVKNSIEPWLCSGTAVDNHGFSLPAFRSTVSMSLRKLSGDREDHSPMKYFVDAIRSHLLRSRQGGDAPEYHLVTLDNLGSLISGVPQASRADKAHYICQSLCQPGYQEPFLPEGIRLAVCMRMSPSANGFAQIWSQTNSAFSGGRILTKA